MNTRTAPDATTLAAPSFGAGESSLAVAHASPTSEALPATLSMREARETDVVVLEFERSSSAFRRAARSPALRLALLAFSLAYATHAYFTDRAILASFLLFVATCFLVTTWGAAKIAIEGTRIHLSSEKIVFSSDVWSVFEGGEATFDARAVFAFGVQFHKNGMKLVALDRDGEVRQVRCNVHEPLHVAYIASKLNQELAKIRDRGHYRS